MTEPSNPSVSEVVPKTIDVLQELRDAQGNARAISLIQAKLEGQKEQMLADAGERSATLSKLAALLDEIRADVDLLATEADLLPAPYNVIAKQIAHWVDVGDDALKPIVR